jgi:hypothetical protein
MEIINEIKNKSKGNELCIMDLNEAFNPFGKKFTDIEKDIKEKSPYRNFLSYSVK